MPLIGSSGDNPYKTGAFNREDEDEFEDHPQLRCRLCDCKTCDLDAYGHCDICRNA